MTPQSLVFGLKAVSEITRLRVLNLCFHGELTVGELSQILGKSQPSLSRHVKVLCDARILSRHREGRRVWFRVPCHGSAAKLARMIVDTLSTQDDDIALDLQRLENLRQTELNEPIIA